MINEFDKLEQELEQSIPEPKGIEKENAELDQKTFDWYYERMNRFTGSRIPNLMKRGRAKGQEWGETALNVVRELATWQTMTDEGREMWVREQMSKDFRQTRWGNENESLARDAYAEATGYEVKETGFTKHSTLPFLGGSFDGEINGVNMGGAKAAEYASGNVLGIIEIKCPYDPVNHTKNYELSRTGLTEKHEYYGQIQCNIEVAGVDWCDFVSFDPRQGESRRLVIIRVERNQVYIDAMIERGREGWGKVEDLIK